MRIGIDCRTILNPHKGEKAGVGHYTYYLVKHLLKIDHKNEYILYFDYRYPEPREFERIPNVKIVHFPFSRYKRYLPFGYSHILITAELIRDQLDVFHSPANIIPLQYKKPSVVTVHDLAIYRHPEWFPSGQDFSKKVLVPSSLERAKRVIAVSESTKKDILKLFKTPKGKIDVIHEGFAREKKVPAGVIQQVREKFGIKPNYVFYIGVLEPRKNLAALIKAFDSVVNANWKRWKDWQLVLAGSRGWKYDKIIQAIRDAKCGACVRYIGYITHQEKMALMTGAKVFAFPSMWEGFGLPVLEAMSIGTPVLSSRVSAIPEVADGAAVLVNPGSQAAIKKSLYQLMSSEKKRAEFSKKGKERAKRFSWTACARQTLRAYYRAAGKKK